MTPSARRKLPKPGVFGRLVFLLLSIAFVLPTLCAASVHAETRTFAVLVAIGSYKYSTTHDPSASFGDLKAPAADLKAFQGMVDRRLTPSRTWTLVDQQATRDAILGALAQAIAATSPGDQVLFYYSGHGGQYGDVLTDEADTYDETLVPYDGRGPDGVSDIVDDELALLRKETVARGAGFVAIIDACHSGTPLRGALASHVKSVPGVAMRPPAALGLQAQVPSMTAPGGYWVSVGAASDDQAALEVEIQPGLWRSRFTDAMIEAAERLPRGATYREVVSDARLRLRDRGAKQWISSEGELGGSFLGAVGPRQRLFEAMRAPNGQLILTGGKLLGVRLGAQFAVFGAEGAASQGGAPLALVTAQTVDDFHTVLGPVVVGPRWPDRLTVVETAHSFGDERLRIMIFGPQDPSRSRLTASLSAMAHVELVTERPEFVFQAAGDRVAVTSPAGEAILSVQLDGAALLQATALMAQHHVLLALRSAQGAKLSTFSADTATCTASVADECTRGARILQPPDDALTLKPDACFFLTVTNSAPADRFFYLLHLGADFAVDLLSPPPGAQNESLAAGRSLQIADAFCNQARAPLTDYFLTLSTKAPLDVSVLQQSGLRAPMASDSPLERLLGSPGVDAGARRPVPLADWDARILAVHMLPGVSR